MLAIPRICPSSSRLITIVALFAINPLALTQSRAFHPLIYKIWGKLEKEFSPPFSPSLRVRPEAENIIQQHLSLSLSLSLSLDRANESVSDNEQQLIKPSFIIFSRPQQCD